MRTFLRRLLALAPCCLFLSGVALAGTGAPNPAKSIRDGLDAVFHACDGSFKAFDREYSRLEEQVILRSQGLSSKALERMEQAEQGPAQGLLPDLLREVFPEHLPKDYPARLAFLDCPFHQRDLHKALNAGVRGKKTAQMLEDWRLCLDAGYLGPAPETTERLYACYRRFAGAK